MGCLAADPAVAVAASCRTVIAVFSWEGLAVVPAAAVAVSSWEGLAVDPANAVAVYSWEGVAANRTAAVAASC